MVTPVYICGAECGLAAVPSTDIVNLSHVSNIGAAVSIESTIVAGAHSARSFKFNPAAATTDFLVVDFPSVGSPATIVARFMLRYDVLPNALHGVCDMGPGTLGLRYNPTGTKIEAFVGTTGAGVFAGSFVPSTGVWYRIDVKLVRGTTWTVDWQVNGSAQTQASKASQTAAAVSQFRFGSDTQGSNASAAATATYYMDDMIVSGTSGDYPIGAGGVQGLFPNADGTHSYVNATDFKYNNSTNVNATSSLETGTHSNLANPLSGTVGNFMSQNVIASTEYLAWAFDDLTANYTAINGVCVVSTHHSSTASANTQSLRILDGATEGVVFALLAFADTGIDNTNKTLNVAPSSGAAWTVAKVNALQVRWGFSTDVSPVPFIDGVCLEVDGPITAGTARALASDVGVTDNMRVATSAKATRLNEAKKLLAKLPESSSAKATRINKLETIVAKAPTATSAKATILRRAKGIAAKSGTASSAKATILLRAKGITAKLGTASSAKATILRSAKGVAAKAGTASSAKASLRTARPITAKAPTATSAKASGIGGAPRALAAKVGTADGAKATTLRRARPLAVKLGTASSAKATALSSVPRHLAAKLGTATSAKASLTTQHAGQKAVEAKLATATSAKASLRKTEALAGKAATSSSAKAARLNRLRSTFAAPSIATATNAKAVTLGFAKGLSVKAAIAASAKANLGVGGTHVHLAGKLPVVSSAKAQHQVSFVSSGFNVARAMGGHAATSTGLRAALTTVFVPGYEAFNVARAMVTKASTATSAKADLVVSYMGSGGFNVLRPIAAKAPTSSYARAIGLSNFTEGFRVLRHVQAKAGTATGAHATLGQGVSVGPGFAVARAMGGKIGTASSAKAALGVTHGTLLVKLPTAASAKATLHRAPGLRALLGTASSAKAVTQTARAFAAKAATAMAFKPAFLTTQHAGQKSLGAKLSTAAAAHAGLLATRQLAGKAATASSAKANVSHRTGFATKAPTATSAWATMGYGRAFAAKAATAVSLRAALSTASGFRVTLPTATSAKASLSITKSTTLGGATIDFDSVTAGVTIDYPASPSRSAGVAVTYA